MRRVVQTLFLAAVGATGPVWAEPTPRSPVIPQAVSGKAGVKEYLLKVVTGVHVAAGEFKQDADAYAALCTQYGSPEKAAAAKPGKIGKLILALRDEYRRIDSFGYEYVEGIVAGVPGLAAFDVELDAGIPAKDAGPSDQDTIAPVKITAGPLVIDREGSLNNFLIEPTVFGTNDRFTSGSTVLQDVSTEPTKLPNPLLTVALADYAVGAYTRLLNASKAWEPTDKDCFEALAAMTPTLGDYFEEWKESKTTGGSAGGRFVAVSRVSDMRGIMSSTRLMWQGVEGSVKPVDAALVQQVSRGYDQIVSFVDDVEAREKAGQMSAEQIDALGSQAKEKTDKVTAQVVEAAALVKVELPKQ